MVVLGISDGQTSGAAIVIDGKVVAAINEERIVRIKNARGFPRQSIAAVIRLASVRPEDIDGVGVAQYNMEFKNEVVGWDGWFEESRDIRDSHNIFFNVASKFGTMANKVPISKKVYYNIRKPIYQNRRNQIAKILEDEFSIHAPVVFFDHHFTHAASVYYSGEFEEALVVTMDGGGDGSSSHVYVGKRGILENLNRIDSYDSLGNYYAYVTSICGYKAKKHEGKITGLAAYGQPIYYDMLNRMITYANGKTINCGQVLFKSALKRIRKNLGQKYRKEDLACSIQKLSEDICREYIRYWMQRTRSKRLRLAGGIFANVRINQELHELKETEDILIHPGMSDEGLAVGAALALWAESVQDKGEMPTCNPLQDVYLGFEFTEKEIEQKLRSAGLEFYRSTEIEKEIALLLADGYVVARFNGRSEYGPRALGNRSILYQPTDRTVNNWLNKNLVRTEFMPFAPSIMAEFADQCLRHVDGAFNTSRFMTITFDCTAWMKKHCPGVVHIDGTARPQLVRREDNPSYYRIIEEFYKLTGLPCIINTSFNMHEEPIVCSPDDAIRAFQQGHLDYLAMGDFLVRNPEPLSHRLLHVVRKGFSIHAGRG